MLGTGTSMRDSGVKLDSMGPEWTSLFSSSLLKHCDDCFFLAYWKTIAHHTISIKRNLNPFIVHQFKPG